MTDHRPARAEHDGPPASIVIEHPPRDSCRAHVATAPTRLTPRAAGPLSAVHDLRNAVCSFATEGPGKATFEGR